MTDDLNAALDRLGAKPEAKPRTVADFPEVPEGYWQQAAEILAPESKLPVPAERGAHLEQLVDSAMGKLGDILALEVDILSDDPLKLISIQKDAAIAVINLANKVDENRFRKKSADAITSILQQVVNKEKALGITISVPAITH